MAFIDLGTRNKGTFWEYLAAYSFLNTYLPDTEFKITLFLGAGEGIPNKHCHSTADIERNKALFIKEFERGVYSAHFFNKLRDVYLLPLKDLKKIYKKKDFSAYTNKKLVSDLEKVFIALSSTHKPMLQALYTMHNEDFFSNELRKALSSTEKNDSNYINAIKALLLTTIKKTFADQETEAIYDIVHPYWSDSQSDRKTITSFLSQKSVQKKLLSLVKQFGWFHMEYMHAPFTIHDYESYIEKNFVNPIPYPSTVKKEIEIEQKKFFQSHAKSAKLKKLATTFQEFAFVLDQSKVVVVEGNSLAHPLFDGIGKRIGVSWQDLLYLTFPEITTLLEKNKQADKNLIANRKEHRVILLESGKIKVFEGKDALLMKEKLLPEDKNKDRTVKGIIAYPGRISGKVVIIYSIDDKEKFKKGDILVTHDGTAELTIFLKQAGAVVTDQGGMICHAAIIARETKTPCIVGTRNATKVLKDGDMVEVDAEKGIVRIL